MQITTRNRMRGFNRNNDTSSNKIPLHFDLNSLDMLCNYLVSGNSNIKRNHYLNLRTLVEMLDVEYYVNDQEKYKRILFIKKGLEGILDRNIQDKGILIKYINGGILDGDILPSNQFKPMSNNEIEWVSETVSNAIKFSFIYQNQDPMIDAWTRFKNSDYKSVANICKELETLTANLNTMFRKARAEANSETTFSLNPDTVESALTDAWNEVTSKYRKLITGMQGFNQLIGGGFENTRVYLLLGLTGAGKSMTLINIALQLKKYNKSFQCKDPTKRPCILILTMENTVVETIQRIFQISTGEDFAKQESPKQALEKLRTEGELYLTDESPINIIIKYQPNRSQSTDYLYTIVEDLEDEGYETIALILDHAKRIRAREKSSDIRLELGEVINELKTFAMEKKIPVITNSHLNRDAARTVDESAGKSKADLTRLFGKSNIGESLLMLDNVDFAAIVNPEYDKEKHKWMVFKAVKTRIKIMREYICQPFDTVNEIKLIEDYYSPIPVFKESMYENPVMNNGATTATSKNIPYMQSKNERFTNDIPVVKDDEEENIYDFVSRYSSEPEEQPKKLIKPITINIPA